MNIQESIQPPVSRRVVRMPGLSLRLIFLIVTAFGFLFAFREKRFVAEKKIAELKAILGEVSVTDIEQLGIKERPSTTLPIPNNRTPPLKQAWLAQLFLPRAGSFRLYFSGSGIGPVDYPRAEESFNLESGYRQVELRVETLEGVNRFSLLFDDDVQLTREFDGGIPLRSFFSGVCRAYETKQQPANEPLEIIRNLLGPIAPTSPNGKALNLGDGILIWIEKR